MFDSNEIAEKALVRAEIIKRERAGRKRRVYAIISAAACLILIVGLSFLMPAIPGRIAAEPPDATSAALLAESGVGGYVFMGVTGFALGGAVTILFLKAKKKG